MFDKEEYWRRRKENKRGQGDPTEPKFTPIPYGPNRKQRRANQKFERWVAKNE